MEKYRNILTLIDSKLAENEMLIDSLIKESISNKEVIARLEAENKELKEKIDSMTL